MVPFGSSMRATDYAPIADCEDAGISSETAERNNRKESIWHALLNSRDLEDEVVKDRLKRGGEPLLQSKQCTEYSQHVQ
jgi:hypothetical protein